MVSRSVTVAARVTNEQGDVIEEIVRKYKVSESKLFRGAIGEYISNHYPEMVEDWNGVK